jgi:hypothetical protein
MQTPSGLEKHIPVDRERALIPRNNVLNTALVMHVLGRIMCSMSPSDEHSLQGGVT